MASGSGLKNDRKAGQAFTLHHYTKTLFHKASLFNRVFQLDPYFAPMIGDKKEVKIADIGAGMFSTTGNTWPATKVEIHPSDELAEEYMQTLKKFGVTPLFPIEKQDMEHLTYPDESFDIVHCVNALDHCVDPYRAIKEMYRICRKDGWIYLRHYFNTALTQKGRGLHKWNLMMTINDDCIFWGELGNFMLSSCISGFQNIAKKETGYERYRMMVSVLHKTT